MIKILKRIYSFLAFVEQERINAMIYCGKGWS